MAFGLFKKKKDKKLDTSIKEIVVKEVIKETEDAVSVHFEHPTRGQINYRSGQYFTLIFEIDGKEERRAYSVCSSPFTDANPAVAVKRVDGGKVSNYINSELKSGDTVRVIPPMGNFTTDFQSKNQRSLVLIGGGSGITPLMSLAKSALDQEKNSQVILLYANRDMDSIIFKEKLKELNNANSNFSVIHVLENDANSFADHQGYVTEGIIKELINKVNDPKADYFVCGPAPMMDIAIESLEKAGVDKDQIIKESFTTDTKKDKVQESSDEIVAREVTVIMDEEEYKYTVKPKETILEKGLDENIDLPFSCQSGLCTACRGKCLSGKVQMDESSGLTDAELEEGYVLPCQSHPLTDDVVIEIG